MNWGGEAILGQWKPSRKAKTKQNTHGKPQRKKFDSKYRKENEKGI